MASKKVTHIQHIEEYFWNSPENFNVALQYLKDVLAALDGDTRPISLQMKFDGAPCIFFGYDSAGVFHVGTKGAKVFSTEKDIREYYKSEKLADKLCLALWHLPKVVKEGVWAGDYMYGTHDVTYRRSLTEPSMMYFRPNTITYGVDENSALGRTMSNAVMGIAVHSRYEGDIHSGDLKGYFGDQLNMDRYFSKSPDVYAMNLTVPNLSGSASFSDDESKRMKGIISAIGAIGYPKGSFSKELASTGLLDQILRFINMLVKQNVKKFQLQDFALALTRVERARIATLKTARGKVEAEKRLQALLAWIKTNAWNLQHCFTIHALFVEAKEILLKKFNQLDQLSSFIETEDGYRATNPEGFVLINNNTQGIVKLVDRFEFSRINFTQQNEWRK